MPEYTSVSFVRAAPSTPVADDETTSSELIIPAAGNLVSTVQSSSDLNILEISTTVAVLVSIGAAPNATSDSGRFLLPAGATKHRGVRSGRKVAVVLA